MGNPIPHAAHRQDWGRIVLLEIRESLEVVAGSPAPPTPTLCSSLSASCSFAQRD